MQRFLPMIFAEGSSRPKYRSRLRFKCSSIHEFKTVDKLPVHELGAVNDHSLRFKYSATSLDQIEDLSSVTPGDPEIKPIPLIISGRSVQFFTNGGVTPI